MKDKILKIYCDGGARGNPGPGAAAFVVIIDGKVVYSQSKYLGVATNNYAEYAGVVMALEWLVINSRNKKRRTEFFLDSELVVNQLSGKYKVKSKKLKPLAIKAKELDKKCPFEILYHAVPRSRNKLADYLVNKELDEN